MKIDATRPGALPGSRAGSTAPTSFDEVLKSGVWAQMSFFMNEEFQTTMFQPVGGMDMIGKAFERLSDPDFIEILARNVVLPVPPVFRAVFPGGKVNLSELLRLGAGGNAQLERQYRARAGEGVQGAISEQFARYCSHDHHH